MSFIKEHFSKFHAVLGKQEEIPVFVSISQIQTIQTYIKENLNEKKIEKILAVLNNFLVQVNVKIFESDRKYPSPNNGSHRDDLGRILKIIHDNALLKKKDIANFVAIFVILKLNQLKNIVPYTDDMQLLEIGGYHKDNYLKTLQAVDISLAIADAHGEFIRITDSSDKVTQQEKEDFHKQISIKGARKSVKIRQAQATKLFKLVKKIYIRNIDKFQKESSKNIARIMSSEEVEIKDFCESHEYVYEDGDSDEKDGYYKKVYDCIRDMRKKN